MRNETGFYEELLSSTGIKKEWIAWDDEYYNETPCLCMPKMNCDCDRNAFRRYNYPRQVSDASKVKVENPKAIVDQAIPEMEKLESIALVALYELMSGTEEAEPEDIILSLSTPTFMLQEATESIKEIKDIGQEQKEQKTWDLVMMVLAIVFTVIPFAGQAASLMDAATAIGRVALIVGETGQSGC
ncbi:hypothetical protein M011DRAFT_490818 [Sporormia fimetaria CBS 119925]|uniref:Uncharacterized protein n=1 Tax=Sporormia fimetaria CBS 119925 TaxID=1340428 RepID=A0A6A6UXN5_9PLEO|nr:hypothetical protein M011DRAFT_490818 [Sporormia fimetaria CBS 119925]